MKKFLALGVLALFLFGLTGLSIAATNSTAKKVIGNLTGQITAVDSKTLTLKGKKSDYSFILVDTATVKGKGRKKIEDLKVGDKIAVKYQKDGDKRFIITITVLK
jgi:hypothetical protein